MSIFQNEAFRGWLYRLILALIPILIAAGIALPGGGEMWVFLAAALLGIPAAGLAAKNSSVSGEQPTEQPMRNELTEQLETRIAALETAKPVVVENFYAEPVEASTEHICSNVQEFSSEDFTPAPKVGTVDYPGLED